MIRALLVMPAAAVLAACSSTTPSGSHAAASLATGRTSATPAAASQRMSTPTGAPPSSHVPATAPATLVPAGHTGHVAPATASGPIVLHPPAAGTYAYTMTNDSGTQDVTATVSALQGGSDTLTWHQSSGSTSGQLDETLSWPGSGVLITEVELHTATVTYTCALSPAITVAPSPLATGDTWSSDSTCSTGGGTLRWSEQDKVTGSDTVQVGGVPVFTELITATRSLTFSSGRGTLTSTSSVSDWYAPSLGLDVRDQSTTTSSSGGTTKTSTSTLQLDSTQPS